LPEQIDDLVKEFYQEKDKDEFHAVDKNHYVLFGEG